MTAFIENCSLPAAVLFLVLGFVFLVKGADIFVEGSSSIAKRLHVPSIIIGLTIVAMGTSLPETAVSVTASIAGNNELAVSNAVGSNIFNLMVVIGFCAVMTPVAVQKDVLKSIFFIVAGAAGIALGGDVVVNSASNIATKFGMSQTLVGLTIVSIGTSLPELVTSIVAARKNEVDMALGNAIGSNIFNILMVLGIASAISPIAFLTENLVDIAILMVFSILVWIFAWTKRKLTKPEGAVMLLLYAAYVVYICMR